MWKENSWNPKKAFEACIHEQFSALHGLSCSHHSRKDRPREPLVYAFLHVFSFDIFFFLANKKAYESK